MTTIDQTREQFLAERRKGMGGSDVAAALGLDYTENEEGRRRYRKTPYQLYLEKVEALDDHVGKAAAVRRGNFLEAAVLARYAKEVKPETLEPRIPFDVDGWRRGNMDARAVFAGGNRRTVEVKTVNRHVFRKDWGDPWTDEVPDRALCQGLWYAALDQSDIVDFAVVVIPDDPDEVLGLSAEEVVAISQFHVFQAQRAPEVEASIIEQARSFWFDNVLAHVPPACTNADDVELRWPRSISEAGKPIDEAVLKLVDRYAAVTDLAKHAQKEREELKERLLIFAGGCEYLLGPDGSPWVQMKTEPRSSYVVPACTPRVLRLTKWWNKRQTTQPK